MGVFRNSVAGSFGTWETDQDMKLTIKGTNIKLTDSIREYIDKKIGGLEKFAGNSLDPALGKPPVECWIEVERTTYHHQSGDIFRAEAQIRLPGTSGIRAEASEWDLHQAIDEVKDELQRQLKRYKRKIITKRRGSD
jgi:putative sigma-54 modulation protein